MGDLPGDAMGQVVAFTRHVGVKSNDYASRVVARPAAAFYADRQGDYSFVNQEWSRLTGVDQADAAGEGWLQSVHPCDRAEVASLWREVVGREGFCNLEFRLVTTSQRLVWVLCQAMPQYDMDGAYIGYGGMLFNITAYRSGAELPGLAAANAAEQGSSTREIG